jgi:hypothetical protein
VRKPDLICKKKQQVRVIDAQVVASNSVEAAHTNKINKYQRNPGFTDGVKNLKSQKNASLIEEINLKILIQTISYSFL